MYVRSFPVTEHVCQEFPSYGTCMLGVSQLWNMYVREFPSCGTCMLGVFQLRNMYVREFPSYRTCKLGSFPVTEHVC